METAIPIRNLYYLLCYAWNRLEERDLVDAAWDSPPRDTINLLGRVLVSALRPLMRRGFDRGYTSFEDEIPGIRGRILLGPTVRRQLVQYGRTRCEFDELLHDTPANRVIRGTLSLMVRSEFLDQELRHVATAVLRSLREVRDTRPTTTDCRRVIIHRNNRHYGFVLELCEMILAMVLPSEDGAGTRFRDFARDPRAMASLFEQFVRSFYTKHAEECGVRDVAASHIAWAGEPLDEHSARHWPQMHSDITLVRDDCPPLVIDCKFYSSALTAGRFGGERLSASNLHQLFTYVLNLSQEPGYESVEGLLIYAQTGEQLDISHTACGRRFRAATVDLNAPWPAIHQRLVQLVHQSVSVRA